MLTGSGKARGTHHNDDLRNNDFVSVKLHQKSNAQFLGICIVEVRKLRECIDAFQNDHKKNVRA